MGVPSKPCGDLTQAVTACVPQITVLSDFSNFFGPPDFTFWLLATLLLTPPICPEDAWYVGDFSIEWHLTEVPPEDLNGSTNRFPIRTDVIAGTHMLPAGADLPLGIPLPPPANAHFAVIKLSIANNPSLTDASIDYLRVALGSPAAVPAASQWGIVTLIASVVLLGAKRAASRRRAK